MLFGPAPLNASDFKEIDCDRMKPGFLSQIINPSEVTDRSNVEYAECVDRVADIERQELDKNYFEAIQDDAIFRKMIVKKQEQPASAEYQSIRQASKFPYAYSSISESKNNNLSKESDFLKQGERFKTVDGFKSIGSESK